MAGKTIYEKLAGSWWDFAEDAQDALHEGATYSPRISTGECDPDELRL